jgi:LacI family transcriptional regulator
MGSSKLGQSRAPARPHSRGALHHIRRHVLLLLGVHYHAMHSGIARYAREADWALDDTYMRIGLAPKWWRGDGILGLITNPRDVHAVRQFPGLPLVDLSKGWISDSMPARLRRSGLGRARVYNDNACIGRLAAEHFTERGFKHIAFLNAGNYWTEVERLPAFREAVEAAKAQAYEIEYYKCFPRGAPRPLQDRQTAHRWLIKTLRQLPKPLAIAVSSDYIALRVFRACDDAGLAVPEQVAVLGCNNDPLFCDYAAVPLSSVDSDLEGIGYAGAKLLDRLMNGEAPPPQPVLIPPKGIVTRMSTNIMAVPDVRVARALRFIWEHHAEPIGTREVGAVAGLSRSALERVFKNHIGRNVAQEILQRRIDHARKLLLETDLKAHEIAARTGFSGIVHFSQAFHRLTGTRPSVFRRQHLASERS